MATATKNRNAMITVRRSAPMVSKSRFEDLRVRSANATKRLRDASAEDTDAAIGVGSALALALYERNGKKLPTVMGLDPALFWGTAAWALTRGKKGKTAGMGRAAGLALVTIGVNRSAMRGSLKVGDDGSYDDDDDDDDDL